MKKQKIHKWLCIILFGVMLLSSWVNVCNSHTLMNEQIDLISHNIGTLAETPFMILLVKYLFDRWKERNANRL